jgi:hypothetical protein
VLLLELLVVAVLGGPPLLVTTQREGRESEVRESEVRERWAERGSIVWHGGALHLLCAVLCLAAQALSLLLGLRRGGKRTAAEAVEVEVEG